MAWGTMGISSYLHGSSGVKATKKQNENLRAPNKIRLCKKILKKMKIYRFRIEPDQI
jgi:hypothetical protein